ncbi:PREDICTED: tetraspanin-5-like [Priapulus caudatus]|uniref:Tetraspanin n=1 Tax=Priapulus caudatus TaxID=37621 RepID=A0ABM1EN18_PRICU|nr:PREDICTED: tetraspanin-5-like [Priapulus caudatus]
MTHDMCRVSTLDPAFVLILVGAIAFVMGFAGCVGALRENTYLLLFYAAFLGILLFAELGIGILGFVYKDWVKDQVSDGLERYIILYRDDPDLQNLIDWVQGSWLHCCGIQTPDDWDKNQYFNCTSISIGSREACGVPFSCCKPKQIWEITNYMCGYDARRSDKKDDWDTVIYITGCLQAGEEWFMQNLMFVAGIAVGIAVLQIMGICFAQNLRADIFAQKAKWRH